MTVREMIELLQEYPLDAEVMFEEENGNIDIYIEELETELMN